MLGHTPSWWLAVTVYSWPHLKLGMRQLVLTELQLRSPCSSSVMMAVYEFTPGWPCHEIRASLAAQFRDATTSSGGHGAEMKQRTRRPLKHEILRRWTQISILMLHFKERMHLPLCVHRREKLPVSMVTVSLSELLHMKLEAITYAV